MEVPSHENEKPCENLLLEFCKEHGISDAIIRRSKYMFPELYEREMRRIKTLQKAGLVEIQPHVKNWIINERGQTVQNTERKADPDALVVHILPKAEEILKTRTTVTRTETTVQETFQPKETSTYAEREKLRLFKRTERGYAITHSTLEDFLDAVKSRILAIRCGQLKKREVTVHRIFLDYSLLFRGKDIPADLKAEARACRDSAYNAAPRKRKPLRSVHNAHYNAGTHPHTQL